MSNPGWVKDELARCEAVRATALDRYSVVTMSRGEQHTFTLTREGLVNLLTELPDYRLVSVTPLEVEFGPVVV